jgi:uncharacterized protein YbaP (TraB family)
MIFNRRTTLLGLGALSGYAATFAGGIFPASAQAHPVLYKVQKGSAQAYILGFSDARDVSWLTPAIRAAFDESKEVWFETPPPNPNSPPQAPAPQAQPPQVSDRSLFSVLRPELSARLLAAAEKYGVPRERLEHVPVWRAYFILNGGYIAKTGLQNLGIENYADVVLSKMAFAAGKSVKSEFATDGDVMSHFVSMSDAESTERLEFLLDYLSDEESGRLADRYDWVTGANNSRTIDNMRKKFPRLYQVEHVRRNIEWARRIESLLSQGGTYFVVIGLQHTLGPDSVPNKLKELGLHLQTT